MSMRELSQEERRRYSRTVMLPEIGKEGQARLLESHALIVGCGALGSIVAMQLAASGVGHLTIVDFDTVDISNLQRQLAFTEGDIGQKKSERLAAKIHAINSGIEVKTIDGVLKRTKAERLMADCDIAIEGSDNPATKYMVTDVAEALEKPCVLGAVSGFSGQVQTFAPGHAGYRDWWPEEVGESGFTPCSLGGLLGPVPSLVASLQSAEAIKILAGLKPALLDTLLTLDTLKMEFHSYHL